MNSQFLYIILALIAGACVPFQTGGNTTLTRSLGNGLYASLVVFIIGGLTMAGVIAIQRRALPSVEQMQSAPIYAWSLGGILGAAYIFLLIFLAPKLGIAATTGFVVAGQLMTAILFDHFGFMGFNVHALNWQRLLGIALLLSGLFFIKKY
jgi:bacterial/archaeal transporter family-2 protein